MNPQVILPAADALPLPASALMLQYLLQFTFLLHLLAMNALLGGLILTLFARLRGGGPDDQWTRLADAMAGISPSLVAATVTLGVAPLLFLQTLFGQFLFTSSILMGWGWFSIVVVLIFAYYGVYIQSFRGEKLGSARTPLLAATVLLFLWVGFIFTNNTTLMLSAQKWGELYFTDPGGRHLNLGAAQLWPRWLHMVNGAVAVAGLMLAWWGRARLKRDKSRGAFMIRVGVNAFTWCTLTNIILGLWYYLSQPGPVRKLFMGGSTYGTVLFGAGFLLGIALFLLGLKARRQGGGAGLWHLSWVGLINLVIMILMRDLVRRGTLGTLYTPADFAVQTQTLNLVIFTALLLGGIGVLIWMVRALYLAWDN